MDGMRFIRSIRLQNILSYGPDGDALELEPLNVLIGPNASGKSNLIEALSLLAAAPRDLQAPIREGGGVGEWTWKGADTLVAATVEATIASPMFDMPTRYRLAFCDLYSSFDILEERIETEHPYSGHAQPYLYYRNRPRYGLPLLNVRTQTAESAQEPVGQNANSAPADRFVRHLEREEVKPGESILSQRRDISSYPELTMLATYFERMDFYREWNLGRFTPPRRPQQADLPNHVLLEDASNLGLVLSKLLNQPKIRQQILDGLKTFYPAIYHVGVEITGGVVQIFFHERGLHQAIPAMRLSDGSLRYLCLLAVLLDPFPLRVVCIEEPELGLHPDVIPDLAKLLVEASQRMQLFVTTHSDILVDALTETPEAIIVCEKPEASTQLRRLDREELKPWLERYRLGELWISGELGGNRW